MVYVPEFELSEQQRQLRSEIQSFVAEEIEPLDLGDYEWREDPNDRVPWDVVEAAGERGLQDLTVPEEYGGMDASPLTLTMAAEEVAAGEMGIAVILDQCWKITRIIDRMATPELRETFFTDYVDDHRHVLAITFTEPENGSNYITDYEGTRLQTTAEKDGDEWVINGIKRYISNGADARTYVVFAQTDTSVPAREGTTAFLVPRDSDGLEVTNIWEMISQRLNNNATVEFDDVRVPEEFVLGTVDSGMTRTSQVLKESNIEAGATALGTARRAFEDAFEYANERQQGGSKIVDHQVIGHDFAEMAMEIQAARSLLWTAARAIEGQGEDYRPEYGGMAKVFAAEQAFDVAQRSLEKFGGAGVMLENDRPMEKYLRDTLSFLHSDGTQTAHTENVITGLQKRYEDGEFPE